MLKASFLHQEGISTRIFLKLKIAGHLTLGAVFLAPEKKSSNGGHMQDNLLTVSGGNMGAMHQTDINQIITQLNLNNGQVWYLNGPNMSGCQMVWFSNGGLKTKNVCYMV